jgi:hypothetical protein
MARKVLATLDLNGPLTLTGAAGTSGQVLTSGGAGTTPTWTTVSGGSGVTSVTGTSPIVSSGGTTPAISVDQTLLYPGSVYVASSDYVLDFASSATAQSMLEGTTKGITVGPGVYEFEFTGYIRQQFTTNTSSTIGFYFHHATVSGTPTVTKVFEIINGSNTTTTAATTLSQSRSTANTNVTVIPSVSGTTANRYTFLRATGRMRVTGAGSTVKLYPALVPSAITDNIIYVLANSQFTFRQISTSGTATSVGTWS